MHDKNYLSVYAKSFSWAGFFLPKGTFKKCSALYDFCRVADNIADDDEQIKIKEYKFQKFENDFNQKNFNNLIIKNMWSLIDEFNISLKIIHDLFDGIRSDIKERVKLNSKKDLLIYSYRVAGTVGLMMAKILKVSKKNSLKSAIDLGIAMQLTNISRDVIEDSKNNRFYINENFDEISSTIRLADNFYKKIGHKILNKNNLENYKNSGKIYVSNIEKTLETFLSIFDLIKLSLSNKNNEQINHNHLLINEEININERI